MSLSFKVVAGSPKKRVFILGCLVAASGLVAWQRGLSHDLSFANDHSVLRTAIPASLKNVPVEAGPSLKPTLALKYSLGDRLKITLFESVDLSDEEQTNIPLTGLVERTELTGEYVRL